MRTPRRPLSLTWRHTLKRVHPDIWKCKSRLCLVDGLSWAQPRRVTPFVWKHGICGLPRVNPAASRPSLSPPPSPSPTIPLLPLPLPLHLQPDKSPDSSSAPAPRQEKGLWPNAGLFMWSGHRPSFPRSGFRSHHVWAVSWGPKWLQDVHPGKPSEGRCALGLSHGSEIQIQSESNNPRGPEGDLLLKFTAGAKLHDFADCMIFVQVD